jgi:hypothetical protein
MLWLVRSRDCRLVIEGQLLLFAAGVAGATLPGLKSVRWLDIASISSAVCSGMSWCIFCHLTIDW